MPSPFPGMDPYLEDPAFWRDFHARFINVCSEVLSDHLPPAYEARIDEQLRLVDHGPQRVTDRIPDVSITREDRPGGVTTALAPNAVEAVDTVEIPAVPDVEEVRDRWIEVLHRSDRSLVTMIEVLSPTNKENGYAEYRQKRFGIVRRGVNLVEIDLLLGGRRVEFARPLPAGDYYAFVTRAIRRDFVRVSRWGLRDTLPTILIPLKPPDPDIGLNMAEVFAITYERGRYARSLGYAAEPAAPLKGDSLAWAKERAAAIRR
jgi:hypothetical protein